MGSGANKHAGEVRPFDVSRSATGFAAQANSGAATTNFARELIVGAGTTSVQLSFSSVNGTGYTVQYKTNLNLAVWTTLTNITATGSSTTITDNTAPVPRERYYRVTSP